MNEAEINKLIREYLEKSTPVDWHQVAWNWNWDSGTKHLKWMIENPKCDKGTALLIYWYANPAWFTKYIKKDQVPDYELDDYLLVKDIEKRYPSGFYKNENIFFDPTNDEVGGDWTKDCSEEELAKIPKEMLKATTGKKLKRIELTEGIPQEIEDKINI